MSTIILEFMQSSSESFIFLCDCLIISLECPLLLLQPGYLQLGSAQQFEEVGVFVADGTVQSLEFGLCGSDRRGRGGGREGRRREVK